MKILLTGGLGYIGSHTAVELIEKQHEVIILDNVYNSNIDVLEKLLFFISEILMTENY